MPRNLPKRNSWRAIIDSPAQGGQCSRHHYGRPWRGLELEQGGDVTVTRPGHSGLTRYPQIWGHHCRDAGEKRDLALDYVWFGTCTCLLALRRTALQLTSEVAIFCSCSWKVFFPPPRNMGSCLPNHQRLILEGSNLFTHPSCSFINCFKNNGADPSSRVV